MSEYTAKNKHKTLFAHVEFLAKVAMVKQFIYVLLMSQVLNYEDTLLKYVTPETRLKKSL